MKLRPTLVMLIALAPFSTRAVCIVEPLEPELRNADIVYVGTVVRSELATDLATLHSAERRRDRHTAEIRHVLAPEFVLKGDPAKAPIVSSAWTYNDPKSDEQVYFPEKRELMPGDTLLVVAKIGELVQFGICTDTRRWDPETAEAVHAVFPSSR